MLIYTLVSLTVSFTHDIFFYSYNSIYIIFVILLLFDIYMPSSSLHMYSERPHSNLISPTCKCHVYSDHLPKLINIFFVGVTECIQYLTSTIKQYSDGTLPLATAFSDSCMTNATASEDDVIQRCRQVMPPTRALIAYRLAPLLPPALHHHVG